MNPHAHVSRWTEYRFPRVSGDEPVATYTADDESLFSPRERG